MQIDAPADRGGRECAAPVSPPPDEEIDALRLRYLGPDRRAGQGIRNTSADGEDDVFRSAGFAPAQSVIVPDGRTLERTADDLVASVFSMSYTAPHLFGDRIEAFESDLRAVLAAASPTGRFVRGVPPRQHPQYLARRPVTMPNVPAWTGATGVASSTTSRSR